MNRRNFVKGLLAIGAGFSILPPSTTYARIWRVEKAVLQPETGVGYIWNHYYMAWSKMNQLEQPKLPEGTGYGWGAIERFEGQMWYRYSGGWVPLEKKRRPTNFTPREIHPTVYLGKQGGEGVTLTDCWNGPGFFALHIGEPLCGAEGYINQTEDAPNYIPNIVMEIQPNGNTKYFDVGPVRESDTVS